MSAPQATNGNIVDKVITFFDPVAGGKRMAARGALAMSGAWTGARWDRRSTQNWFVSRGSADADSIPDLIELRARSRDMARNNPLALGAINTVVLNAAGTGLSIQPTPDREILGWDEEQAHSWSQLVAHEFALWAESKDCDITRTCDFYTAQSLLMRTVLESGDALTLLTQRPVAGSIYDSRFQLIEADRIRTPGAEGMAATLTDAGGTKSPTGNKVYGGVEVDPFGAPVAYCVLKQHPGAINFSANLLDYDRLLAFGAKTGRRLVLHHFDRMRPDQNRGVPYLAPVIEILKQLDRYTEAELMAAVLTAAYTIFIKSPTGDEMLGSTNGNPAPLPTGNTGLELGNGLIVGLPEGTEAQFPNPMRPNAGFDPFVMSMLRQVGVALQLPFEVLVKHFTASYSAARSALLEAWKFYANRRAFLAQTFCQPVFEMWLDEAVSKGRVQAPGYFSSPLMRRAYLSADWVGDAPGQIDPLKEVQAAKERVDLGVSDLHWETTAMTGRNYPDVHARRVSEHTARAAAGLEPNVLNSTATEMVPDTSDQEDAAETENPAPPVPPKKGGGK